MAPFGRYKFNRMPLGLIFVPELFQCEMFKMLGYIEGVIIYFDGANLILIKFCNGLAEKRVAIAKNIIKLRVDEKDAENNHYPIYNTTPVASMQLTPTQLFFGSRRECRCHVTSKQHK